MENHEIISAYYKEAVSGVNENMIMNEHLWYSYVVNLPEHLQVVYTISLYHWQVLNGGHDQYFTNLYGLFAYLTIKHLKAINAVKSAAILEKAVSLLNVENVDEDEFRRKIAQRQFDNIMKERYLFEELDDLYFELEDEDENLEQLIITLTEQRHN